jgi:hypothetical protein
MLVTVPDTGLVVAVLANGRGPGLEKQPAQAVAEAVLCALLPGYAAHWPGPSLPPPPQPPTEEAEREMRELLAAELGGQWQG